MRYLPKQFEEKWQKKWLKEGVYEPDLSRAKKPFYNLMMFPYPSAEGLHVGNMYAFTGADIYGRFKRMQGFDVFEPIGLDGFGIHSENYAMKVGKHPADQAKISEKNFYRQLGMLGNGFAWQERLETYDPEYYKWTQWIFAEMFRRGLAYRKKAAVNWCPSCKTVLADEQVIQKRQATSDKRQETIGVCERCDTPVIQKDLEQWFFGITKYAERLLKNLDKIDWSEKIKIAQKNWIGKSEGALIEFRIKNYELRIKVFTTRPDTLFGATFIALSPEYVRNLIDQGIPMSDKVKQFIEDALHERNDEVTQDKKGVDAKIVAVNPANGEEIPVWVVNYVLGNVGTGAIMAVPAHDQRDFEFAKKYDLLIRQVIAPETGDKRMNEERRDGGCAIVFDPIQQKYAVGRDQSGFLRFFGGGVDTNEDIKKGVLRELTEESGLYDFSHVERIGTAFAHYHNRSKQIDRVAHATCFLVILKSTKVQPTKLEEHEKFVLTWASPEEIRKSWYLVHKERDTQHWAMFLREAVARAIELGFDKKNDRKEFVLSAYTGDGILVDSGKFSGMDSESAKWEITKAIAGKKTAQYRLRDWLISRQRYWGPPIPLVFCEHCATRIKNDELRIKEKKGYSKGELENPGWIAVPTKDLPVKLPYIKEFRPTGKDESPLASVEKFYKVRCPKCKSWARRETDVSDTFLDSAWYYLGYFLGTKNAKRKTKNTPWDPTIVKKWLPVDMYIGGAEHAVLHLLYVRFVTMALKDWKMIGFEEPVKRFRAHGLIIKDGVKMSKSKGNVVNPDEYIRAYGADALRMYLMFLGPFEEGGDFRDSSMKGITRFLERMWKLETAASSKKQVVRERNDALRRILHKTIKKVTEDIEGLQYNTAISALMILLNEFEENRDAVTREDIKIFLKLLAPFAPHMSEELWQNVEDKSKKIKDKKLRSVHREPWPKYNPGLIQAETFELVVQVNGKFRAKVSLAAGATETEAKKSALALDVIKQYVSSEPKKVIFVPNKLINFVV